MIPNFRYNNNTNSLQSNNYSQNIVYHSDVVLKYGLIYVRTTVLYAIQTEYVKLLMDSRWTNMAKFVCTQRLRI